MLKVKNRRALLMAFDHFLAAQGVSPDAFLDEWGRQLIADARDYSDDPTIRGLLRAAGKQLQGASMDWYCSTK